MVSHDEDATENLEAHPIPASPQAHFFCGFFDGAMLSKFVEIAHSADESLELEIIMNSCGGDSDVGLAIYDLLTPWRDHDLLKTVCLGHCASAASVFIATGSSGKRWIYRHSLLGLHDGAMQTDEDPGMMQVQVALVKQYDVMYHDVLARATGKTPRYWRDALAGRSMLYLSPREAKKLNLIDVIL